MQGKNQKLKYQRKSISSYFHKLVLILKIDNLFLKYEALSCQNISANNSTWASVPADEEPPFTFLTHSRATAEYNRKNSFA